jgi:chromosome partitioning protein
MRVALISSKGGAGKSALAISLAAEALARGQSVLLVDADHPQGTCLIWAETASAAGHPVPTTIAVRANMHHPDQLPKVAASYDWVVIDTPGRLSDVQRAALMFADVALVPTGPSAHDTWALAPTLDVIHEAQALRPALRAAIVITRKQARTAVGRVVREGLKDATVPVLRSEIGYRVAWQECAVVGQGVTTYAPGSPAAADLHALFHELTALGEPTHGQEASRPRAAARTGRAQR